MDYISILLLLSVASLAANLICPVHARRVVLLLGSYVFLALWNLPGLGILVLVTALTYFAGLVVETKPSRYVVGFCIVAILLPMCLVRLGTPRAFYLDLASDEQRFGSFVPFGLSFFTLQAVGYLLDIRLTGGRACRRWLPVALYLAFFPKLLAGPIERGGMFIPQLIAIRLPDVNQVIYASKCILLGLFSKLVIANALAGFGAEIARSKTAGGGLVALACVAYSYEIYLDFFAYSVIAVGVAKLLGINLSDNFRTPYAARTLRDFWRRWHITLSFWFRDYIYKPLGGSRANEIRRWGIVLLVFVCSGLWHGSAWTFALWGGLHGILYLVGVSTLASRQRISSRLGLTRVPRFYASLQGITVFTAVTAAWVFFRSPNVGQALGTLSLAVGLGSTNYWSLGTIGAESVLLACGILVVIACLDLSGLLETFQRGEPRSAWGRFAELATIDGMLMALLLVGTDGGTSFIYFSF